MEDRTTTLWDAWRSRGDGEAFADLVRPEVGRALGLARSNGCGPEDAEDAVQDALVQLATERGAEPDRVGVRAWFFRAVRDRARTRARAGWRRRKRERAAARPEAVPGDDGGLALREQVERALLGLDEGDREAVRLRYLLDLEYREMAYVLGASEEACRVRVHRAVGRLKERLGAGAAALLGSLAWAVPQRAPILIQAAIVSAQGAGAVAGGTTTGGAIAMAATGKMVVGVAVGLALGLAGGFLAGTSGSGGTPGIPPTADPPRAASAPIPKARETAADAVAAQVPASGVGDFQDLDATPDERRFLREALAADRARRAALRLDPADGGLDVLRKNGGSAADAAAVLSSFEFLASRIRTGEGERRTFGATAEPGKPTLVDLGDVAGKSAILEFGAGTFALDERKCREFSRVGKGKGIESLEIRGAGMDGTVLACPQGELLLILGEIRNLRFRDLTLELTNGSLIDLRGGMSLCLERVRVRSPGGQELWMLTGDSVVAAKGCEFIGNGRGIAMGARATMLGVFENCVFADWESVVVGWSGAAAKCLVSFLGCDFENCRVTDSRIEYKDRPEFPVKVTSGGVRFGSPDLSEKDRRVRWGSEFLASLEGTTFGAGVARCTVGDLAAVLDRLAPGAEETPVAVWMVDGSRGGPSEFAVETMDRKSGAKKRRFLRWTGGVLEPVKREDRGGGPWIGGLAETEGTASLQEVLRLSGLAPSAAATSIRYGVLAKVNGESVPTVVVQNMDWWPELMLDARTGVDLRSR